MRARAGVNSKGIGINQFKSKSGIGAELELKDFEREELELKNFEQKELELNGKELSI